MYKLLPLLLITGMAFASTNENKEVDIMLKESLALAQHFKQHEQEMQNAQSIQGISFFTVGADGACGYSSIQTAIDDFFQSPLPSIEIRIATNKTYFENIVIGNADVSLTGGYSNCTNANAGVGTLSQALIDASNSGTVITVQGVTTRRTMEFKNLRLINGNSPTGGGGLLSDNSDVALLLENVDIRNNNAIHGAGIAILGGNTDLLLNESLIFGNIADYGGGIYCSGSMSSINVANHSGIISNFANNPLIVAPNGRGGGAYITGCYFALFTGSNSNASFTGMEANSSMNFGGAIYVENSIVRIHGHQSCGSLGCLGDDNNPVAMKNNLSNFQHGAAIYADSSDVKINAALLQGNSGESVIYATESDLTIERFFQPCWSNDKCNLIENNTGTVIAGLLNNSVDISSTSIIGNDSTVFDINVGHPASPSLFRVESSMINDNGGNMNDYLFNLYGFIDAIFVHNTIADNQASQSIIRTDFNSNISLPPLLEIQSTIIHNPLIDVYSFDELDFTQGGDQMHINVSACFANETTSLTSSILVNDAIIYPEGGLTILADPLFVDRNNGNYHLSATSPAIDYINTSNRTTVIQPDIDYETRGFNDPNTIGTPLFYYDVGADEVVDKPEIMFMNGFE